MYLVVIAVALSMTFILHGWPLVRQILPDTMYFIAGIDTWIPGDNGRLLIFGVPYITHLWSISTEIFFYLVFPLSAVTFTRSKSTKTIALIGLTNLALGCTAFYLAINYFSEITSRIAPRLAEADGFGWLTYYSPYIHLFQFLAGCIACHLYLTARDQSPTRSETFGAGVIGYLAAFSPLAITISFEVIRVTEYRMTCAMLVHILTLVALPFLMLFLARYSSALCRVLSLRPIVVGGEISYSIYLLHPFVLFGMQTLFERLYQTSVIGQVSLAAATSVLVILMSFATYHLIERPAKRWIRGQTARAVSAGDSPGLPQICVEAG
jgi:acetyltransferase